MPARLDAPNMPSGAGAAHRAISGNGRLHAFRFILRHPNCTRAELAAAEGMSLPGVHSVLAELEELGYVRANTDGPRNGRTIRYNVDRSKLTRELHEFVGWALVGNAD